MRTRASAARAIGPEAEAALKESERRIRAGKELAEAADALHEIADKGDLATSKSQFDKVKAAAAKIEAVAPATYYCPMHCEGSKTYDKPGECPVCHMKLKKQTSEQFTVEVKPIGGTITAGKPANLLFTIKDPRGPAVEKARVELAGGVEFHRWCQWVVDEQLAAAPSPAREERLGG